MIACIDVTADGPATIKSLTALAFGEVMVPA